MNDWQREGEDEDTTCATWRPAHFPADVEASQDEEQERHFPESRSQHYKHVDRRDERGREGERGRGRERGGGGGGRGGGEEDSVKYETEDSTQTAQTWG